MNHVATTNSFNTTVMKQKRALKVRKRAKIRNLYNQAPHLPQDTNGKVTTSQVDITYESREVIPFPAGDHKAPITDAHQSITKTRQNVNSQNVRAKEIPQLSHDGPNHRQTSGTSPDINAPYHINLTLNSECTQSVSKELYSFDHMITYI